jgi:hypothetical protein
MMAELPHPWDIYARLQAALLSGGQISNQSWGTEAAMNRLLDSVQDSKPLTCDDIARVAASERRRERHRTTLRLVHLAGHDVSAHPEDALAARHELHVARSKVSERDWSVLCQVAAGYDYAELPGACACAYCVSADSWL